MKPRSWFREHLFESCVAASFALHAVAWGVAWALTLPRHFEPIHVMDVDLNTPFRPRRPGDTRLPGAAKGAPAKAPKPTPGVTGPQPPAPKAPSVPVVAPPQPQQPVEKPWVLPTPETQKLEKPTLGAPETPPAQVGATPQGTGAGGEGGRGGSGGGPGTGDAIVNRPARLINREEVRTLLRRNYPEVHRRQGHEAMVLVGLLISSDGKVQDVTILQSSGAGDFDDVARQVARKMVFEPELKSSIPSESRHAQRIYFKLAD